MKSKAFKRTFFISASVLWMLVIFLFSAQQGEQSAQLSNNFTALITWLFPVLKNLSGDALTGGMAVVSFIIRKAAHFSVYAVLSMLVFSAVNTFNLNRSIKVISTLAITVLYAVSDEIHQAFVPGRVCTFFDVCVDLLGAIFGIIIMCAIILPVIKYFKSKKKGRVSK